MFPANTTRRSNFPTRPERQLPSNSFPEDLLSDGKNLCTVIQFVNYQSVAGLGFLTNLIARPTGGITLPIPKKINDNQTITWQEESATRTGLSIAAGLVTPASVGGALVRSGIGTLGQIGSAFTGLQLNPYLFMVFQQPNFKEFSFSWTFAPKNERESRFLSSIINQFKDQSLPANLGPILDYPQLALIRFLPNDIFDNLKFKPCAVTSVLVDYTGAGPSFFKDSSGRTKSNGAPTIVNLTVNFKEIQLWYRGEW